MISSATCSNQEKIQRQYSQTFFEHKSDNSAQLQENNYGSFQDVTLSDTQEHTPSTSLKSSSCSSSFLSCLLCCCKTDHKENNDNCYQEHKDDDK